MNLRKHLAGLAIFLVIFVGTVFIFNYLTPRAGLIGGQRGIPLPSERASRIKFSYEVPYVSLDFINRKSYTTLLLQNLSGTRVPAKLWVRTYFFAPDYDRRQVWAGEAVELNVALAIGGRHVVTSAAACDWCQAPSAPKAGYYARVVVSNRSAEDTYLPDSEIDREITTAVPVVVQAEQQFNR
ncbi:MAG TPA: hypothetical protein VJT09_12450 [Pyrinomonadaceae bacterium]|nr:hypothetical protein [Pyrinomonadaceae bacterium]